jgi:hypothetical protein
VTTGDGKTHKIWEFNLLLKTDTSESGLHPGRPVIVGASMHGDRASIIFAEPLEISAAIERKCD